MDLEDYVSFLFFPAVRLVNNDHNGNNSDHYGIVEIYRDAKWWKLSDSQWSNADANVVCHYLGYDRASEIYTETFSRINATVLSVDFKCRGNEGELADCFQEQRKTNASYKAKGSGVRCTVDGKSSCKTKYIHAHWRRNQAGGEERYTVA